jgi:glycosyltransferase involved in cell wall biosynthesis
VRPSLSIAIPSYNRTEKVYSLLEKLALIIPINVQSQIEIVISDNHSSIPIETLTHFIKYRVVKPEIHLNTAEENLAFLFRFLGGEYVWVLGDDDIPLERGFTKLWHEITNTNYDLIIFNSLTGDNTSNEIIRLSFIREKYEESLFKFASRAGMWSVLAGFSTLVFKREKFDLDYFDQLHKKIFIYIVMFSQF